MFQKEDGVPKLIQCGDHSYAPWALICVHLMKGTAKEWVAIEVDDGREVDNDYICPDCAGKVSMTPGEWDIENLRAVCIHCLRDIPERSRSGMRFTTRYFRCELLCSRHRTHMSMK